MGTQLQPSLPQESEECLVCSQQGLKEDPSSAGGGGGWLYPRGPSPPAWLPPVRAGAARGPPQSDTTQGAWLWGWFVCACTSGCLQVVHFRVREPVWRVYLLHVCRCPFGYVFVCLHVYVCAFECISHVSVHSEICVCHCAYGFVRTCVTVCVCTRVCLCTPVCILVFVSVPECV